MDAMPITLTADARLDQALWARFVAPVLDGTDGRVRQFRLTGTHDVDALLPIDAEVIDWSHEHGRMTLAESTGWAALFVARTGGDLLVSVRAAEPEHLEKAVAAIRSNAPIQEPVDGRIAIDFWQVANGAWASERTIDAPSWSEIEEHYPLPVRRDVETLFATTPGAAQGRIILWYGPPGTGKTTAIRSFARAWKDVARLQIVLDPDAVLGESSVLMQVLLDDDLDQTGPDGQPLWRVLVIEDADELVRADAKARMGQAMSRLLNVGDGIVGQGLRVLVLLTTNEPIGRMHPALARPGRCLARTEFRRFTRAEAIAWRGDDVPAGDDLSLAEILNGRPSDVEQRELPGQYL